MRKKKLTAAKHSRIRKTALLLSFIVHLLFLFAFSYFSVKDDVFPVHSAPPPVSEPQKKLVFELVDTPKYVEEILPSEHTTLGSDQNTRVFDLNTDEQLEVGLPYNDGFSDAKNYPLPYPENVKKSIDEKSSSQNKESEQTDELQDTDSDDGSFLADLIKKQSKKLQKTTESPEPDFNNILSSASDFGGFSFNTYNWNFAPYLLTMKKRIRDNINLPYAFTHLGAVSGKIKVYFVVLPSGVVSDLNIITSDAHYSLEQSSVKAIEKSSAFLPLPADFPEDKLEVTASFSFTIIKDKE